MLIFAFIQSRINEYSPTDVSKANERSVNRRNNVRFNPKATVEILSQGEQPSEDLDDDQKRELVQKYIEVSKIRDQTRRTKNAPFKERKNASYLYHFLNSSKN